MTEGQLNDEFCALVERAKFSKIAPTTVIGLLFIQVINEARRGRVAWSEVAHALRLCWQQGLPERPAAGMCPCLRLTLVDVPRAAMNRSDPHHPSCEYYLPPPPAEFRAINKGAPS